MAKKHILFFPPKISSLGAEYNVANDKLEIERIITCKSAKIVEGPRFPPCGKHVYNVNYLIDFL